MLNLSIVIPVFNEEGNAAKLHQEIAGVLEANRYEGAIIFVADGSTDSSPAD